MEKLKFEPKTFFPRKPRERETRIESFSRFTASGIPPAVDVPFVRADSVGADHHAFQDGVGSLSRVERSMNAPGSPSSALQMMYFFSPWASRQNFT